MVAVKVIYVERDIELDLREPDLGSPELPDLWERIYGNGTQGVLRGVGYARGTCQPGCPEWMYLKKASCGRRFAAHLRHGESQWARESDEHKALKERIARAATTAG